MTKLWNKGIDVDKLVEKYTVGNDYLLDQDLISYDCKASLAHAKALHKAKIISSSELTTLQEGLAEITRLNKIGKFPISISDEDGHTAIENYLVKKFGEVGKKIHTGRSRNDQVLTALRLYEKDKLDELKKSIEVLIKSLKKLISTHGSVPIPGYTHMQKAMPSSVELLFGTYVEALSDDLYYLGYVHALIDQSPLGSAAGFGTPGLDIDRKLRAKEMGFSSVMENTLYCQNSRGKFESQIVNLIVQIMMDLNKISSDLILFSMDEFGFFSLPPSLCTGSSIMPQKKNPDVLELIRAKYSVVLGYDMQIKSLYCGLISGYNRDVQLTKEPLMNSLGIGIDSCDVMNLVISDLTVNKKNCSAAMSKELFATEEAYKLVSKGMPFRDAYKKVGKKYS